MSELSIDAQESRDFAQAFSTSGARSLRKNLEIIGWLVVAALIAVGLTSVIGRGIFVLEALTEPNPEAMFNAFDIRYYDHYIATFLHLIPALLIVSIGPMQFITAIRNRYRTFHRWSGRVFLVCGAIGAHREWMIRSWSIMLGIATERVLLGVLMASTDIGIGVLFGATFWMAAVINISAAEFWIQLTRTPGNGVRHWKMVDAQSKVAA